MIHFNSLLQSYGNPRKIGEPSNNQFSNTTGSTQHSGTNPLICSTQDNSFSLANTSIPPSLSVPELFNDKSLLVTSEMVEDWLSQAANTSGSDANSPAIRYPHELELPPNWKEIMLNYDQTPLEKSEEESMMIDMQVVPRVTKGKFNLDPIKRAKSDPGMNLDDMILSGIDPESLDPHVLKRIKNTESARRSRIKRQAKLKNMEDTMESQNKEITRLREVTALLKQELTSLKAESETAKVTVYRLHSWLRTKGVRIPAELELS